MYKHKVHIKKVVRWYDVCYCGWHQYLVVKVLSEGSAKRALDGNTIKAPEFCATCLRLSGIKGNKQRSA